MLFSALSFSFSSCSKDDDPEEQTEQPDDSGGDDTPSDPDKPDTEKDHSVSLKYCPDKKHPHLIDLGEGMKWACCNVGAKQPSEYGGFYAWAETKEKECYDATTYLYCDDQDEEKCWDMIRLYDRNQGMLSYYSISGSRYDVAWMNNNNFMMPNNGDIEKLRKNTTFTVVTLDGVEGIKVTGPSKKLIFLPGGGKKWGKEWLNNFVDHPTGYYWGGERWTDVAAWDADGFFIDPNYGVRTYCGHRIEGLMVRGTENTSYSITY